MNGERSQKIRFWYGVALAGLTAIVGILFIFSAARIYGGRTEGVPPFTRELVGRYLKWLIYPLVLWILAIVAGYILSVVFPYAEKNKPAQSAFVSLRRLKKRIPDGQSEEFCAEYKKYRKQELVRILCWSFSAVFALAVAIGMIVYLSDPFNFDLTAEYLSAVDTALRPNAIIVRMVKNLLPWVGVALALFIGASLYEHFSAARELDTVKRLLVLGKGSPVMGEPAYAAKGKAAAKALDKWQVRIAFFAGFFVLAVVFIVIGALDGGVADTMAKAIALCRECVGIG